METVILTIHLILALLLIGVVLLQKNEGAALLSGGGNTQARPRPTALTRFTWLVAAAFIATSLVLTILATRDNESGSVIDTAPAAVEEEAPAEEGAPAAGSDLLPPVLTPDASDAPATEAPEATTPAAPAADPTLPPAGDDEAGEPATP